jgi:ubiquinone/menaquinone biosynthesis C-methylase UbiE
VFGSRKFSRTIEFRIIREWLPATPVEVLDLAAGGGEYAQQFALLGHSVTALDYDSDALREANTPGVPQIKLVAGDAHYLPFPDASFDLIVCNSALEHFADDERALAEMARVLRENGRLIITTDTFPAQVSRWLRCVPSKWRRAEVKAHPAVLRDALQAYHRSKHGVINYYSAAGLGEKLARAGLLVKDSRHYLNGLVSKSIFEAHLILKWLDLYNPLSRRLFPLFFPFTFPGRRKAEGYGLAVYAVKAPGG